MANIYNTSEGTVYGSYFDDAIVNDYPALVYGFAGNDQITNIGSFIYADADEGNDILINYASNAHVYLFGGGGNDYLANSGNSQATLYGGYQTSGTDNDILVGNPYYPDIFILSPVGGNDVIYNYNSNDVIFCYYNDYSPPVPYVQGNDVIVRGPWMTAIVSGAAYQPLNFGYLPYGTSYDTASEESLWGNANTFYGTAGADNFFIDKAGGNDLIFDAAQGDTIHLCDTTLSDIVATSVSENSIAVAFNTGEVAMVGTTENISPTFKLASGESYVYNRESGAWQQT